MKKVFSIFVVILLVIGLYACKEEDPIIEPIDLSQIYPQNDVYYEIFVRSFADSDGNGIGDLNGITQNLDYIEELGATAIWLMPINPSPSYHGYSITDYYDIESDYGTLEDFQNLVDEASLRNIDIIMDLVINHTSDQHPWYISALNSTSSQYRDYYIWNNGNAYESFVGGMKDLNFENPEVIAEVENIMSFYLNMGVHGFRIDAAKHLIEGNNATIENALLIFEFNQYMKEINPDSFLVSEVFDYNYEFLTDYYIGSDSVFNFNVAGNVWDKIGYGNNRYLFASNLKKAYDDFRSIKPDFVDSPFIGNHDVDRVASMGGFNTYNTFEKLSLAARVFLTLPGSPFIYYGDEIGMKGYRYEGSNIPGYGTVYDEYRRQPFLWGSATYQTTWLPSDGSNDQTPSLLNQKDDQNSMFNQYREMIEIRKNNPALMYGNYFEPYVNNTSNIQGYLRYFMYEDIEQAVLVLHNLSMDSYSVDIEYLEILYGTLDIPAYGSLIVTVDPSRIEDYI
ncbi:MAG: hypothetical protein K9L02_02440 [Acholeplasmataceae bacterium]|nr:hypothetical protein [Acholeplasmataceae bacterium]